MFLLLIFKEKKVVENIFIFDAFVVFLKDVKEGKKKA